MPERLRQTQTTPDHLAAATAGAISAAFVPSPLAPFAKEGARAMRPPVVVMHRKAANTEGVGWVSSPGREAFMWHR